MKKLIKYSFAIIVGIFSSSSFALTPIPNSNFKVHVIEARNYNSIDLAKLALAVKAVEMAMNSQELKDKILNFTYNGSKAFVQNNGLTNEQVYNYLMTGAEKYPLQTSADETLDVELQLYKPKWYQSKKVIGYTDQSYRTIFVNQYYYRKALINDVADNMVHEWCHKMGFDHDFNSTSRRPSSVPYAVGYMVDDIVAAMGLD